jgi:hypothetical protein
MPNKIAKLIFREINKLNFIVLSIYI